MGSGSASVLLPWCSWMTSSHAPARAREGVSSSGQYTTCRFRTRFCTADEAGTALQKRAQSGSWWW
ncbi:hypothetical protein ATCV1_z491L [Acanthocystis turfacea chlorella virus 1]|uniref:Uncharacterized protein z491L n=1 Tax=Chlorovirus heliozoae TaxID=322019 RepID=A7K9A1_9PHYC|nr:hypothetical protein ATCV1_z491L [Acanthocystis turfacea chlorella virus 1]ABT16625.1 hypothetical protein ATCV1_z491L [Acanthocystis turfacea chlorella virus 1]